MSLLSVAEALERVLAGATPGPTEMVPLAQAHGRVLAEEIAARFTQPPFPSSAMDGYAVRSADIATPPVQLVIAGESAAGHEFKGQVLPGQAVRIFTGAAVPEGADTVVIQENTASSDGKVTVLAGAASGANIRPKGGDFTSGAVLLKEGTVLTPRALALAAAMGHAALPVRRKPLVAILATGDELVPPGAAPLPGQIVSSTPSGLAAMIRQAGADPLDIGIAEDRLDVLSARIGEAAAADILVTTGGVSVGGLDLVAPALKARGIQLEFWKIAMRPGKPLLYGRLGVQRVLGLSGNPVSALVLARLFLVPLIRALLGLPPQEPSQETAVLAHGLPGNGPRAAYLQAVRKGAGKEQEVHVYAAQDSSFLSNFANADCLVIRPPHAPPANAGSVVPILPIDF